MKCAPRVLGPLLALLGLTAFAEEVDPFLERYASTYRFRLGRPASMKLTPDGDSLLFLRSGPRSFVRDLYELDLATGEERVLLTTDDLLGGSEEKLTAEERARRERKRLAARGIVSYELSSDGARLLFPLSGRLFVVDRSDGSVRELVSDKGAPIDPRLSPDGKRVACVRDGDLYVIDVASGRERRLTHREGDTVTNGTAEFVAQEEMSRHHGFWWSPDSKRLAFQRTDTAGMERFGIFDPMHPEREPQTWPYPRPGERNADVRLGIISARGGATTWIEWDREGFEYVATVRWPRRGPLTLVVQSRTQTEEQILAVDTGSGATRTLLVERDPAWLEIEQKMPLWLDDGSGFLWITERNGGPQLELRNADGSLRHAVTDTALGMQGFGHYFGDRGDVIVKAGVDPTQSHLYRVPLDPDRGGPVPLTTAVGVHEASSAAGRGVGYVRVSATLDGERSWEVVVGGEATGRGPRSVAEDPGPRPELELTTVGVDPEFHAALVRPRGFRADRRYPVIVHVYGGPTSLMVRADPLRYVLDQWIADHGFVVVAIDGRGTPHRGHDWSRVVKNDLIEVPLEDQVNALRLLGERYSELDLARVGIYGWSFGGYFSAMAVMRHPEVFRAGVAGAPVVDWRDYDTHYTERYMDLPQANPDGYRAANVLTYAADLTRPLLLIHGTGDDNVYFMHSLKLANALFRAGRDFDFLPLPGFTHMVPDPLVTTRLYGRILEHFLTSLGGVEEREAAPAGTP